MNLEKQRRTFLSYSRINKDFALKLAKELKSEGFNVWLDQLDIPLGARWDREVEKALKESEIFMIILTSASVDSENVLDEIGYAIDTHKRLLPILLEECEVPLRLRRFQYVDFTNKSFDDGVEAAKGLLRGLIAQNTVPRKAVAPDAQPQADHKAKENRKAKEEAEQLAKAETERKAMEEFERNAKAEAERKAKVEAERKAKEEAERLAKMEANRKAREQVELRSTPEKQLEPLSSKTPQKKPIFRGLTIGIGAVVLLGIAGIGIGYGVLSNRGNSTANTPIISPSNTQSNTANTPEPTPIPKTPIKSSATFMNASDTKNFYDSENWVSIYDTALEQHTEEEINNFKENKNWIPVTLNESKPAGITYGWCALNADILQDNLDHITFFYEYDGLPIPKKNMADVYFTSDDGWDCIRKVVAIDEWGTTGEYHLSYGLSINQKLNDGENDFNAGDSGRTYLVVTVP